MKKILLVCVAMLGAFVLQAATTAVSPGTDAIKNAIATAAAGDVLELATGDYIEKAHLEISKDLTIKAATGATPVLKMAKDRRINVTANATLQGLTIDKSNDTGSGSDAVRITGNETFQKVAIVNCTFQNTVGRCIKLQVDDANPIVDSIVVRGCYFKKVLNRPIYILNPGAHVKKGIVIQNCTFDSYIVPDGQTAASQRGIYIVNEDEEAGILLPTPTVVMDHCTIYDYNLGRSVYFAGVNTVSVTNCILANPAAGEGELFGFCLYGTSAFSNTLTFNSDIKAESSVTRTNMLQKDPYFVDAANGNFQLYKNSPAVGAATDGSNLGDPRWGVSSQDMDTDLLPYIPFKKPYSMSPTANSVRILWQMPDEVANGVVYYGTSKDNLDKQVSSTGGWNVAGEGYVHVVELTGLNPFTTYYYQVGNGSKRYDAINTCKTAPQPNTAFRMFLISDIHDNSRKIWENLSKSDIVSNLNPDFGMFIGDFVNDGGGRSWNSAFFNPGEKLLSQLTFSSVPGNHETDDPYTLRYSTYYDYFSSPSHGTSEDPEIKDPRGEAYYSFDYGDAKIIGLNLNEGPAALGTMNENGEGGRGFVPGTPQYAWLEAQLNAATSKWIFIFGHVGIYSTGSHGEWSEYQKKVAPLLEKHAAAGKHIIVFAGDDHSFEHLYKAGVHYVRPGCGRWSNYAQKKYLVDYKYSLFYKQISCFSMLDMSADGQEIVLTARDSVGNEFYSYKFTASATLEPSLYISQPAAEIDVTDNLYLHWSSFDNDGNGKISFFYAPENDKENGKPIVTDLVADNSASNEYYWNTRNVYPKGKYWIYGTITNSSATVRTYAKNLVNLVEDSIAPPAPTNFSSFLSGEKIRLMWQNPTHLIPVVNTISDFESGTDAFTASDNSDGKATISTAEGHESATAMQVDYTAPKNWGEGSVTVQFATAQDFSSTPTLEFWYKGVGKNVPLRIVVKTDLDGDGSEDDWWYNESIYLTNTSWKKAELNMETFAAFDWKPNKMPRISLDNIIAIQFIGVCPTAGDGTFVLDDIAVSGQIIPAEDFAGTKILRRVDAFPTNPNDGEEVYNGTEETCIDNTANPNEEYYYAAFAYDDKNNYSVAATSKYIFTALEVVAVSDMHVWSENKVLRIHTNLTAPQQMTLAVYNMLGAKVATVANPNLAAGCHTYSLDMSAMANGTYFVKCMSNGISTVKKIILK